uniref:Nuclear protein MDM1 n=1 Tax=Lygus hesperus TaxID=30085 RepID=A0A0K8T3F7_LYGHE
MIGTFWNLCRACPSMPVDKLHSEYRSTYRWHEYTGPRQEVVRHPPQPVSGNKEEEENKYNTENSQVSVPLQGSGGEMEPLVGSGDVIDLGGEEKIQEESFSKGEKHIFSESRSKKKEPDADTLPETWFSEVIELRKKAGQYKHRGWGTELVPEHIAELYSKQIGLWEQVSRRSSLSALSLASSTHRSITKEEKEKENNKKSSPTKAYWVQSDPKNEKLEDCKKDAVPHRSRMDYFIRHHLERTTGVGRSHSAGSPKKATTRAQHKTPPPEKRQRPTTLQTRSKPSTGSVKHKNKRPKEIFNNDSEKTKVEPEPEPVATEPVVKSPPEPTRVKSPEQILMRSPEPVNWTVPLDTGDLQWRAHSESKVRSEGSTRPTPSQSAPPALPGDVSRGIKGMSKEV